MKGHLDRARKRQRDGGKHESVAMGPTLSTPEEEHRPPLTQWKAAGTLVNSSFRDHIMTIVTNIDAIMDNQWSKSQWIGFNSGGKRLCEDQNTFKQKGIHYKIKTALCVIG